MDKRFPIVEYCVLRLDTFGCIDHSSFIAQTISNSCSYSLLIVLSRASKIRERRRMFDFRSAKLHHRQNSLRLHSTFSPNVHTRSRICHLETMCNEHTYEYSCGCKIATIRPCSNKCFEKSTVTSALPVVHSTHGSSHKPDMFQSTSSQTCYRECASLERKKSVQVVYCHGTKHLGLRP